MGLTSRSVWKLLALASVLAVLVTVPAIGQEGDSSDGEVIRLHLGTDGRHFQHVNSDGVVVTTQPIPDPIRCELRDFVDGPLAHLSGSHHGPGLIVGTRGGSIGVKTGPQGTPCGRISGNQELTLALGAGFLAERASFDLELKGDVALELQLNTGETFIVRSGSRVIPGEGVSSNGSAPFNVTVDPAVDGTHVANCQFRADSGPDAGANDNCYVTVVPTSPFNQVAFTILSGEVSLEGSGDYENNPDFDTIFYLTRFEGDLDCGDVDTRSDGDVEITVRRLENLEGECVLKPYRLLANADDPASPTGRSVTLDLAADGQMAAYEAFITFPDELNNPTDAVEIRWSTEPPFELSSFGLMEVCVDEPFDGDTLNEAAIPPDEEGCIISVSQDWRGNTVWHVIFTADPNWH